METIWFWAAAVVMAVYVVADGFDFGAGALHLAVAKTDTERRQVLAAIGPFWDGNEVWLLAGGGVLFLAFPKVLASGLSGLYLAIVLVLWVLILRGIAIEFRSHLGDGMWRGFWDATFWLASSLAPVLFGAALGNLLRGLPLDGDGWFELPLFGSFSPAGELGILDWYTVLVGAFAYTSLLHHGALFIGWKTAGAVSDRSRVWAGRLFPAVTALWILCSLATMRIAPEIFAGLPGRPLAWLFTALAIAGWATSVGARRAGRDLLAFVGSSAFLIGLLAATAATIFPTMIKSSGDPARSLTAFNAAAGAGSLSRGLYWWPPGLLLVLAYFTFLFRYHRGRVTLTDGVDGY